MMTTPRMTVAPDELQRCGASCSRSKDEPGKTMRQGRAWHADKPGTVPPIVHQALRSPGQPLDDGARRFMESRFGHDFNRVRVHSDAQAAAAARSVDSLAFTVGPQLVFGAGQYAPATAAGRRLLAHELTHVLQQGSSVSAVPLRLSVSALFGPLEDEAEEAANAIASDRPVAIEERAAANGRVQRAPLPFGGDLAAPLRAAAQVGASIASCDRTAPLTWTDFAGKVPKSPRLAANTDLRFDQVGKGNTAAIRAVFNPRGSWVKRQASNPTNRALNGGAGQVRACQQHFDRAAQQQLVGVTFNLTPGTDCAATPPYDPSVIARARGECETLLGPEWDRVAVLESRRLLKHEQYHYNLACAIATKGTRAIATGSPPADMLASVRAVENAQSSSYDDDTDNGCDAAEQARWEKQIDGGLPAVTIPPKARP
jgi:hypothetical protein